MIFDEEVQFWTQCTYNAFFIRLVQGHKLDISKGKGGENGFQYIFMSRPPF
jgi:hypothetical protein